MKVYLDDERNTPEGWTRTYTVAETIKLLETGEVEELSLDNDLGYSNLETMEYHPEGFNVLLWLEEKVHNEPDFEVPIIYIHTANASRAPMMRKLAFKLMNG